MTPTELGERLLEAAGRPAGAEVSVSSGGPGYERVTVDVAAQEWAGAIRAACDDSQLACDFFDWLSAVDEQEHGFVVVAHLWSTSRRHGMLVRTRLPVDAPALTSVTEVYPGAAWHERETYEMFGIGFDGHPELTPLLLPPEFEGHPLRKDFVLASRVAKPWPGAKEPGESHAGGGRRQPMRPPGVPAPGEWGPAAEPAAPAEQPGPSAEQPPPEAGQPGEE